MPVAEYPNIIPVTITVTAMYTGATAEVVNESVGMVLEDQINVQNAVKRTVECPCPCDLPRFFKVRFGIIRPWI